MIKFDRLRPFLIIHRLLAIFLPRFPGCSSLFEFVAVRPTSIHFEPPHSHPGEPGSVSSRTLLTLTTYYFHKTTFCRFGPHPDSSLSISSAVNQRPRNLVSQFGRLPCCTRCLPTAHKRPTEGLPRFSSLRFLRYLMFKNLLFRTTLFMVPGNSVSKFAWVRATSTISHNSKAFGDRFHR